MKNLFTCVTLSSTPIGRKMPEGVLHLNHVSVFSEANELHKQRMLSIEEVQTPYFYFCDDTDDQPNILIEPQKAIVYGDNHYKQYSQPGVTKNGPWSAERHITRPDFIHKAICNTDLAQKICTLLPQGEYYTEALLYYTLALVGGWEYRSDLILNWNKRSEGMHNKVRKSKMNSMAWLNTNENMLLSIFADYKLQKLTY